MNLAWSDKYGGYLTEDAILTPAQAQATGYYLIGGPADSAKAAAAGTVPTVFVPGVGPGSEGLTVATTSPEAQAYNAPHAANAIWVPNGATPGGGYWGTPGSSGGGGLFGGFFNDLGNIGSSISQGVSDLGKDVANSPAAMTVISAIAAANGVDPATTAAILGANKTAQNGDIGSGLSTGLLSYGVGAGTNYLTGAGDAATAAATGADTAAASGVEPVITGGTHIADSAAVFPDTTSITSYLPKAIQEGASKGLTDTISKATGLPISVLQKIATGDFTGLGNSILSGATAATVSKILTGATGTASSGSPSAKPSTGGAPPATTPAATTPAATAATPTDSTATGQDSTLRTLMMMGLLSQPQQQQPQPVQTPLVNIQSTMNNPFEKDGNPFGHSINASSGGSIDDLVRLLRS